jgi:hypothetical protein
MSKGNIANATDQQLLEKSANVFNFALMYSERKTATAALSAERRLGKL